MASVKGAVDGAAGMMRDGVGTVARVGDGILGGVAGGVTGAAHGMSQGLGAGSDTAPTMTLVAAGVTAGALGLVDWPLLALAGGTAYLYRRMSGRPQVRVVRAAPVAPPVETAVPAPAPARRRVRSGTAAPAQSGTAAPARKRAAKRTTTARSASRSS